MEVDAFLADSVQAAGGKLHALGIGWRVIQALGVPGSARPDRARGARAHGPAEAGAHTLGVSLLDPAGAPRPFGEGTSFEARFVSPDGEGTATLALNLDGLVFETEGDHTIVLGDRRARVRSALPFRVQTRPEPPASEFRTGVYL